jgi:hypothetical protein
MKIKRAIALVGFALALSTGTPLLAHHSVAAEFDMNARVTIEGTVTRVEFMNPHVRLWMDVKNADGTVFNWELELPPPNTLKRMRQKPGEPNQTSTELFKPGDPLSVSLWRAKDGSLLGNALSITLPNAEVMNFTSGAGWSGVPGIGWPPLPAASTGR